MRQTGPGPPPGSWPRTTFSAGGVKPGAASHVLLRDLAAAGDDPGRRQAAWDRLSNTNRLAFVRQWFDHPDFDLGVVMAWGYRQFASDPLLAPYCTPRQDRGFFHRFQGTLRQGRPLVHWNGTTNPLAKQNRTPGYSATNDAHIPHEVRPKLIRQRVEGCGCRERR